MRHETLIAACCATILGACASDGAQADAAAPEVAAKAESAAETETIVAHGNEPGWRITLGADETEFVLDYGERTFTAPTPAPEILDGARTYRFAEADVVLALSDALCADDATGMPHPQTALLEDGDRVMNGCAGDPMTMLTGDEWIVEDIGGGGVIDMARTSLAFGEDGRVTGSGACNRYGASYTLTGEGLSIGPIAATRKGCPGAIMDQENRFFDALSAVERFEIDETGALLLYGGGQQLLLARR